LNSLEDWLAWAGGLHPQGIALGLERAGTVWSSLGPPDLVCPVITVGGTNGKGSCVAMLGAMARAADYRVGTYTSPHLVRYNERVEIDGVAVSDADLCQAFERVAAARDGVPLTYFELGTLAALVLFADAGLDLAILEVGLGGRLDAVNLIDPDVAVVTSIGWDHMDWLGDTLEAIAREKAGIFRPGRLAVIGQPDAPQALRDAALAARALVCQVGREIGVAPGDGGWVWSGPGGHVLALPAPALRGRFQYHNAAAAVAALRALRERLPVPVAAIRAGISRARPRGRFQVIPGTPTWILDVAHNPQAGEALAENLRAFPRSGKVSAVLGILAGKDPVGLTAPLAGLVDDWVLTEPDDPRALPVRDLAARLAGLADARSVRCTTGVGAALAQVAAESGPGDVALLFGSFTTVGEALEWLGGEGRTGILRR
jgi:dihydrofolate synthase/folylpolyglutamate synthase